MGYTLKSYYEEINKSHFIGGVMYSCEVHQ